MHILLLLLLLGAGGCLVSFDVPVSDGTQEPGDENECCAPDDENADPDDLDENADPDDLDESEDPEADS